MKKIKLGKRDKYADKWLGLGDLSGVEVNNPLLGDDLKDKDIGLVLIQLMRNPRYVSLAAEILLGVKLLPTQAVILEGLWTHAFPMYIASRGFGKSFLLAVYSLLKMALFPGTKIVIVGAAFRQSRVIWEYMESIWSKAPILRSICTDSSGPRSAVDRCTIKINDSVTTAIPLGDGSKIRGLRANIIIADEFASIPPDIYEQVVSGFAAVSKLPIENVQQTSRREAMIEDNVWSDELEEEFQEDREQNQSIISGTADYDFKHYADYWRKYKKIILNKDKELKWGQIFDHMDDKASNQYLDKKDFLVFRIPYDIIPKGFMDDKIVARAKATAHHPSAYLMEYGAVFPKDSDGFFKRSLIESCVTGKNKPIMFPTGPVFFDARIHGDITRKYVFGIDPAADVDNFTIVILELWPDHTRIVYCWSTNRENFNKRRSDGLTEATDYYGFCSRKIRDLMSIFPTDDIAIDAQGGGVAVSQALNNKGNMKVNENFLWPTNRILNPDKELPTDNEPGLHILHMCQFANYDFTREANHGTRNAFGDKTLLFPEFNPVVLALANEDDKNRFGEHATIYDSLEDCVLEIEDLKKELTTIKMTMTGTGNAARERWETPQDIDAQGKKVYQKKDRYSALIMANYIAKNVLRAVEPVDYNLASGSAKQIHRIPYEFDNKDSRFYVGPAWYTEAVNKQGNEIFRVVKRK